jgi:acetylornithine/succinyldiaminopimelate/putrescine aminotransferase
MDPEDEKIVALARASRVRTNAAEGACVRDGDGRTYVAATVALPSLNLSAIQGAVAMAVSSGADGLEAVAVVTDSGSVPDADLAVVHDVGGPGTPVFRCDSGGEVVESVVTP